MASLLKMSEHGAALQTYNQELVKCLETLKLKRNELTELIRREEAERMVLEKNIRILQDKMTSLTNSLQHHKSICDTYDKTIGETELGFKKILESSQTLLQVVQHEAGKLSSSVGNDCALVYQPHPFVEPFVKENGY